MKATDFLWVEEGEEAWGPVVEVAPVLRIDRTYTFRVPPELGESLKIGQRVRIPLRKSGRLAEGFIVAMDQAPWDTTLRPVNSVVEQETYLSPHLVELGRCISTHYACPLGATLKSMTPQSVRDRRGVMRVRDLVLNPAVSSETARTSPRQQAVIDHLRTQAGASTVARTKECTGVTNATLRTMVKKGLLELRTRQAPCPAETELLQDQGLIAKPAFELNVDQQDALNQTIASIRKQAFEVLLLFGVSGSGKTEVYLRAIRHVLDSGKQAIFLVPEIVLTTQLAARLTARLPRVAVQHSGLTDSQRAVIWRQIAAGEKSVIVGTRSAVFAPCPALGLIVVDEEQESSYKNLQAPRYHVRDVAIMRARQLGIPVLLGSATPSLETWHRSHTHSDYRVLVLPRRVMDLPLPRIHVVDMRDELLEQKRPVLISRLMERHLRETLERGEQAMILVNRRGFALSAFCPQCKSRLVCQNCSSSLVIHAVTNQAMCHYCRTRIQTPSLCAQLGCGGVLVQVGSGTQRIEELLAARFPNARIQRADSDAISRRAEYEALIADLERRKLDVLVGTQMIAKGLDFPHVSFVGMVHSDSEGFSADFRAHERLFQLVTQVAGRAGRASAAGEVVIQTLTPELPALRFALSHDYAGFAEHELKLRKKIGFPPYRRLARFVVSHPRDERARAEADSLAARIRNLLAAPEWTDTDLLGPTAAPIPRLRGQYRYDLLLRTGSGIQLQNVTTSLRNAKALRVRAATLVIDVDPVSLA